MLFGGATNLGSYLRLGAVSHPLFPFLRVHIQVQECSSKCPSWGGGPKVEVSVCLRWTQAGGPRIRVRLLAQPRHRHRRIEHRGE